MEIPNGLKAGDIIYFDPRVLPDLKIITKEEADVIANANPNKREFIITYGGKR